MVKRIDKLTKEQEDYMAIHAQKWIDIGLKCEPADWETYEKAIEVAYMKADLVYPGHVVKVASPWVGALAASIADKIIKEQKNSEGAVGDAVGGAVGDAVDGAVRGAVRDAVDGAVRDAVGGAVRGAVGGAVGGAVEGAVRGAVGDAVGDAVDGAVRGAVDGAVRGAVDGAVRGAVDGAVGGVVGGVVDDVVEGAVRGAVRDAVDDENLTWHQWYGNQFWVGWGWGYRGTAYVDFLRDVCGLELSDDMNERADANKQMAESACYSWMNSEFVIACERPTKVIREPSGQLHYDQGKAIEWPNGDGLFMLHGVRFEEDEYWKIINKELTFADLLKQGWAAEKRAAAISMLKADEMLKGIKAKLIDTGSKYKKLGFKGRQETELYKVENFTGMISGTNDETGDTEYCIKMKHPSLDDEYIEWVEPSVGAKKDADLAQAVAFGWTKDQYMIADEA